MSLLPGPGWGPAIVAGSAAMLILSAGAVLTPLDAWYRNLKKPSWQPPDWMFGPAWTLIFSFTAWAAVVAWNNSQDTATCVGFISLFVINGALNVAWSMIFFKWRRPDWALLEVVALWLSIVLLLLELHAIAPRAGWLMLPYLAWVSFAAFLNLTIVRLNGKFA